MYKQITYSNARENLSEVLNDVFFNNQPYVVTKRNIPMATIQKTFSNKIKAKPVKIESASKKRKDIDMSMFGIWKDKVDDPVKFAEELRKKAWRGF